MTQAGPDKNKELAKQVAQRSFKKASHLQKANQLLQQVLGYFEDNPHQLDEEGLLRLSSPKNHIDEFKKIFMKDPNGRQFRKDEKYIRNPVDVINYAKAAWKDLPENWDPSEATKKVFTDFLAADPPQGINDLIAKLVESGAVEEAKFLHNMVYLGHIVASHHDKNKMGASNVAIVFSPSLGAMLEKIAPQLKQGDLLALTGKLQKGFQAALEDPKKPFEKSFDETPKYQPAAEKLHRSYLENTKDFPEFKPPRTLLGFKLPSWLNKVIDQVTSIKLPKFLNNLLGGKPKAGDKTTPAAKVPKEGGKRVRFADEVQGALDRVKSITKTKVIPPKPTDPPPAPPVQEAPGAEAAPPVQKTSDSQAAPPAQEAPGVEAPPSAAEQQSSQSPIFKGIAEKIDELKKQAEGANPLANVQGQDLKELGDALKGKVGKMVDFFNAKKNQEGTEKSEKKEEAEKETRPKGPASGG